MNPTEIIEKYYNNFPEAKKYLSAHSLAVAGKSLDIAEKIKGVDSRFIQQAAMLHDIGIFMTHAPHIGCKGEEPYIRHGILGKEILEKEGLPACARVAERHIGVGLTAQEIRKQKLPLPERDMTPQTEEEEIIAYADLFFSKSHKPIDEEKPLEEIKKGLARFGDRKINIFGQWIKKYGI
ncbi:MAG: HD domain-containing protein [Patescibacteria group bacterium]